MKIDILYTKLQNCSQFSQITLKDNPPIFRRAHMPCKIGTKMVKINKKCTFFTRKYLKRLKMKQKPVRIM